MGVELFIFDLDGVITHTSQFHAQAWENLTEEVGLIWNDKLVEATKGISRRDSLELILAENGVQDRYTEDEKQRMMDRKNKMYVELLQNITENDYLPGIKDLLETIKRNHHPIAIASASRNAPYILEQLKADRYIDYVVDPSQLNGKPAPDIFLEAARHFQKQSNQCIAIEDAQSGIEAINAASMFAVGVGATLRGANLLVATTDELTYEKLMDAYHKKSLSM